MYSWIHLAVAFVVGLSTIPLIWLGWTFFYQILDAWTAPDDHLRPWARFVRRYVWRPFIGALDWADRLCGRPLHKAILRYIQRKRAARKD